MKRSLHPVKQHSYDAYIIVTIVSLFVSVLFAFEQTMHLPASIRGTEVYNVVPLPMHRAAEEEPSVEEARIPTVSDLMQERLCERVVERFASDDTMWHRVNKRVLSTLGFSCRR